MVNAMAFFEKVYAQLRRVPRGRVTTYADLAAAAGSPKAVRAVGSAMKHNPNAPRVPYHRVVLSDGRTGNYSGTGGVKGKTRLLKKEGVRVKNRRVTDFATRRFRF